MLIKIALTEPCPVQQITDKSNIMIKTASGGVLIEPGSEKEKIVQAEIKKHPNALFFRAKAIKADEPNSNGDSFSKDELLKGYKSFEGVPFFTNHENQDIEKAKGKIIFAEWNEDENSVYTIAFVDRDAYPHICRGIEQGYMTGVSMGSINGEALITMSDLTLKPIMEVKSGDKVLTPYGNTQTVSDVHSEILEVPMRTFKLGSYHKCPQFSPDHPIMVIKGDDIKSKKIELEKKARNNYHKRKRETTNEFISRSSWRNYSFDSHFIESQEVKKDDYFLIPSKYELTEDNKDSDFFYLLGAYVGDGFVTKNKKGDINGLAYYIGLHEKKELGIKLNRLLEKYTDKRIINTPYPEKSGLKINTYDSKLASRMFNIAKSHAHHKRIIKESFSSEEICQLISGYIDTDGSIAKNYGKNKSGDIRGNGIRGAIIFSCNQGLLEDIQSLLILLGVKSSIKWSYREPNENSIVNVPTIDYSLFIPCSYLGLFKNYSIKVNKLESDFNSKIEAGHSFIYTNDKKNYLAVPVKDIEIDNEFNKPSYDLTVENDECYIADGIAIHNCSVEYSSCNICGNKAERTEDYCSHIRNRKSRKFTGKVRNVVTGKVVDFKDELVYEHNHGIKFIELSGVVDPACPSCHIEGIIPNGNYLGKVANIENDLRMVRIAAIEKQASQEELDQINQVLETLENIAVSLIKNRQQVEVEFASELVEVISNLQTWADELVGAGYGNIESNVPGTYEEEMPQMEQTEQAEPQMEGGLDTAPRNVPTPVASEQAMEVGQTSGEPGQPLVNTPKMPISAPMRPSAENSHLIRRVADQLVDRLDVGNFALEKAASLYAGINKTGVKLMGKRRTVASKEKQKEKTMKVLSSSWQEKQSFFEYIRKVPSMQIDDLKLSVKNRDDSFIIVAEDNDSDRMQIWTYEDLSSNDKKLISESPDDAAHKFLSLFAKNNNSIKEGVERMSKETKEAGANTVLTTPEVITQKQLEDNTSELYHGRTGEEQQVITQKQLDGNINYPRTGEKEVITEKQLDADLRLNPRQNDNPEVTTEKQLENDGSGVSVRKSEDKHTITQNQLEDNRTGNEPEVITEKQLDNVDPAWARKANADQGLMKSAKEHMDAVVDAFAEVSLETGATPQELQEIATVCVANTEARVKLATALLEESKTSEVLPFSTRVAYWNSKNVRVATASPTEVEYSLVSKLRVIASDNTINPDVVIDAVDVLSDGELGEQSISNKVDEKLTEASNKTTKVSVKDELRNALKQAMTEEEKEEEKEECEEYCKKCECEPCECEETVEASKTERDAEREEILASLKARRSVTASSETPKEEVLNPNKLNGADVVIETSFNEMGTKRTAKSFRNDIVKFAKTALATEKMKLASITNVTIDGNTIQIAVQTDAGEESVEIPIGEEIAPVEEEIIPEGDLGGEALEEGLGGEEIGFENINNVAYNKSKKMKRKAQSPMGGGMPGAGGEVSAPGAPEMGLDSAPQGDQALQTLTTGDEDELDDEIPTVGEKQAPWSICPECGASDVDVTKEDDGGIVGSCNACGAEYEALVKKNIEFRIIKPTKSVGEEGGEIPEGPEGPEEIPALPVAAQTKLDKDSIVRIAANQEENGDVCPSCGNKHCSVVANGNGCTECICGQCGIEFEKNLIVSSTDPSKGLLRIEWNLLSDESCPECRKEARKFASKLKVAGMLKTASANADKFPTANCIERLARSYGGNTVASFGPCKDKPMAECVCRELKRLGFTKVRQLSKLAEVSMQDPMGECINDQKQKGHNVVEAKSICNCIKKKFASETSDNIYVQAFADEAKEGKIELNAYDLKTMDEMFVEEKEYIERKAQAILDNVDIGDDLEPLDSIDIVVDEVIEDDVVEEEAEVESVTITGDNLEVVHNSEEAEEIEEVGEVEEIEVLPENEGEEGMETFNTDALAEALAMTSSRVRRSGAESNIKLAGKPKVVKTIEQDVEAGVPRANATIRNEGADNIDVSMANPQVPRSNATMGQEVNVPAGLPDVPVDSSYMGDEKNTQANMPPINNEIKGTVIADTDKNVKEAKQMKEIDTVEKNVDAGIPRSNATMGHEGKENIDVNMDTPNVPRSNATMGNEGKDNIDVATTGPDVPVDNAYMGAEKETQSGMPNVNDEILKQVQMKREQQLERIAGARREEALRTTAWLSSNNRIASDKSTFDNVVTALANFEVDKIASVAETMFPVTKTAGTTQQTIKTAGTGLPAIVIESKPVEEQTFQNKLEGAFTIGSNLLNKNLINNKER